MSDLTFFIVIVLATALVVLAPSYFERKNK